MAGGSIAKGVLVALEIIAVSFLIPLVNFVAVPASPLIGGYMGISYAGSHSASYANQGLIFGALLGLVVLALSALVAGNTTVWAGPSRRILVVMWLGIGVFPLYATSKSALGAMYSGLKANR